MMTEDAMGGERELTGRVVLVCGGRDFGRFSALEAARFMDQVLSALEPRAIVHGGARGADTVASIWAQDNGVPEIVVPAQWDKFGKAAGPLRNGWMLDFTKADLVVAFPGGAGTANMVRQARERGVQVFHPELAGAHTKNNAKIDKPVD